jgi:hypothetical protein
MRNLAVWGACVLLGLAPSALAADATDQVEQAVRELQSAWNEGDRDKVVSLVSEITYRSFLTRSSNRGRHARHCCSQVARLERHGHPVHFDGTPLRACRPRHRRTEYSRRRRGSRGRQNPPPGMHRGCQRRVSPRSPEMPCSRVSEVSSDFFRMRSGAILSFALRPAPGQPGRMSEDDAGSGVIGLAVFTPRPSASVGRADTSVGRADTRAAPGPAPRRTRRTRPDNRAGRSRRSRRSGTGR